METFARRVDKVIFSSNYFTGLKVLAAVQNESSQIFSILPVVRPLKMPT